MMKHEQQTSRLKKSSTFFGGNNFLKLNLYNFRLNSTKKMVTSFLGSLLIVSVFFATCQSSAAEFNVKSYGAVGDGLTDDTAAIQSAIAAAGVNQTILFPSGTYLIYSTLVQSDGQAWRGDGGQRATTLKKMFNGTLINMGDLGGLFDLNIDGNGTTYSGNGINIPAGYSQKIERVRVANTAGNSLIFAVNAGAGANVKGFEGGTTNPVVAAIKISGDTGPHPRFFDGIWLSGGLFDFSNAGNGCSLVNFYVRNFVMSGPISGGSGLMHIANGRVASMYDTTTISGSDCSFTGIAFSGPVSLVNAQGMNFSACEFGAGITEDAATCDYNTFNTETVSYSPAWTQPSGTQPAIGNGSLTGWYTRNGNLCTVSLRLVVGSTTTFGNNSSGYCFSLPYVTSNALDQRGMFANIFDSSTSTDYNVTVCIGSNEQCFTLGRNGQGVRAGFPVAFAAGDTIDAQFSYIVK